MDTDASKTNGGAGIDRRYSQSVSACTVCSKKFPQHECNCTSCMRNGWWIGYKCSSSHCYERAKKYQDKKRYGAKAASAFARHHTDGFFCSKACHDTDAFRARELATQLEEQYQWLGTKKQITAAQSKARDLARAPLP